MVLPNSRKYKIAPLPYVIHINDKASVRKIEPTIPGFPTHRFSPLSLKELIESASTLTYLPVGQILIMQDFKHDYPESKAKLIIGLLLTRFTMVKLTLWDNEAALFRQLHSKSNR